MKQPMTTLPKRSPLRRVAVALPRRSGTMTGQAYGDERRPIDGLFFHANGFNAMAYRTLLEPLAGEFHVLALDLRGHGGTDLASDTEGRTDYWDMAQDVSAVMEELRLERVVLAGHSLGGAVSLLAASVDTSRVAGLLLLDPPLMSDAQRAGMIARWDDGVSDSTSPMVAAALRRRTRFASREQAVAAYAGKGGFATWPVAAVEDFVSDGFQDAADGVELACPPEWEASNYRAHGHDSQAALRALTVPTRIIVPENQSACHVDEEALAARGQTNVQIERVPGTTHFLPMERPDLVTRRFAELLRAVGG